MLRICQADTCRLAGVNENVLVYLTAAKHGIPVCPHAGGAYPNGPVWRAAA